MAAKKEDNLYEANSYLYEIFRLNPYFYNLYCEINDCHVNEAVDMNSFINSHEPKSPYMQYVEKMLQPCIGMQESLIIAERNYKENLQQITIADKIEQPSRDEIYNLKTAKDKLPEIAVNLKNIRSDYQQKKDKLIEQLPNIIKQIKEIKAQHNKSRMHTLYEMLDKLKIPHDKYNAKKINNPMNFISYNEAYEYMERQTSIDRTKIPIKNWQNAATDYKIFEKLVIYLTVMDIALISGINYGN